MIETFKDMKHGKSSGSYESLKLERRASELIHRMEQTSSEDSLESSRARVLANARAIYGPNRFLDVVTYGNTSSRKIAAAVVEHNPTGRSYIHCCSAKEHSRLAAIEHLLVIQEDIMQRLLDREGITSSGWLPATAQAQHARVFNSMSDMTHHGTCLHAPSNAPSNAPSKAPSPAISSVPSSAPSQPQPHRPGRVQWIMGSES